MRPAPTTTTSARFGSCCTASPFALSILPRRSRILPAPVSRATHSTRTDPSQRPRRRGWQTAARSVRLPRRCRMQKLIVVVTLIATPLVAAAPAAATRGHTVRSSTGHPIVSLSARGRHDYPRLMSTIQLQRANLTTTILGQSTKEYGHIDAALAGGVSPPCSPRPRFLSAATVSRAPDTDFYQRELAGLTGSRLVQVQRDLLRLAGAVCRATPTRHLSLPHLLRSPGVRRPAAVVATVGIAEGLRVPPLPLRLRVDLLSCMVCGRRRESAASDVDVLIVSVHDPRVLVTVLAEAGGSSAARSTSRRTRQTSFAPGSLPVDLS